MPHTVTQIRKYVNKLLGDASVKHPPIDVEAIAQQLKIGLLQEELDDEVSGLLLVSQGKATIAVNQDHHQNRQRFTVAHEIGHFVLHRTDDDDLFVDRKVYHRNAAASKGLFQQEIEANRFAAELLMPKSMLQDFVTQQGGEIDLSDDFAMQQLAQLFKVSEQALAIRLASLNLIPQL